MIKIIRTDSDHQNFIGLVKYLDADLAGRDGNDHSFYSQFNKIDKIKYAVVVYENDRPISCGAIKEYAPNIMEIKRMYTSPYTRGKGIASKVLAELEGWAAELSCGKCILETGKRQPEAIQLYKKNGYKLIPNYGQYAGIENSVCFEKEIKYAPLFISELTRQEKAKRIAEIIAREKGYSWVGLYDVLPDTINIINCNGALPVYPIFPRDKGLNGRAVQNKSVVIVNDTLNDPDYLTTFGKTQSELIIPILSGNGEVIGTIDVESHSKNAFKDADITFLSACAEGIKALWI